MPNGPTWVERAELGELKAVISPTASDRGNDFHHAVHLFAANLAAKRSKPEDMIIDFGCGTGRFVRFFGNKGLKVVGTEITSNMLTEARSLGLPANASLVLTDGVSLPVCDGSVDVIWCCGVLRYSLFVSPAVYNRIAQDMYRALKPGGLVVNLEMYVDTKPERFTEGFENAGFITQDVRVLKRYEGFFENCLKSHVWPRAFVTVAGKLWGAAHYWLDNPNRTSAGLRDYLFYWSKPAQ